MTRTTIYVVDDHRIVIDGIASFLLGNNEFVLQGSFSSGQQLLESLKTKQPNILLLDIKMPGLSGICIAQILQKDYPDIKVVMLSANMDKESIDDSVKAGCKGYLSKDIGEEEFFEALQKIKAGENYFSKGVQQTVFNNYAQRTKEVLNINNDILSEREIEVIKLFADGLTYNEIAEQLFISKRTVETHKKNILEKLELKSTIDLVKYAILNGLISI